MFCGKCGVQLREGTKFCPSCGANTGMKEPGKQSEYRQQTQEDSRSVYQRTHRQNPYQNVQPMRQNYGGGIGHDGKDYTPIGMWGYFGYNILFLIPLIGFILMLIFSFGGTNNVNLRNYARSQFCWLIILVVLLLLMIAFGGIMALLPH